MPIARFQLEDGRIARFEVPDGTTPEQAQSMMQAHFSQPEQPAPEAKKPSLTERFQAKMNGQQTPDAPSDTAFLYTNGKSKEADIKNGLMTALQGAGMNFMDELAGAGGAITGSAANALGVGDNKTFGESYRQIRDQYRGDVNRFEKEHPIAATGLTVAGSLPTVVGAMPAAIGKSAISAIPMILQKPLQAAATGAAYGGASGLGGSNAETTQGVAEDTLKSAALGGAMGGVLQPLTQGIGAVGGNVAQRFSGDAADAAARIKLAEALQRGNEAGIIDPAKRAAVRMGKLGSEATIADAGGDATKGLLDIIATLPGNTATKITNLIHARQATRAGRMIGAADEAMNIGGVKADGLVKDLIESRSQAAAPLYDAVRDVPVKIDGEMAALLSASKPFHGMAEKLAKVSGNPIAETPVFGKPIINSQGLQERKIVNETPTYSLSDLKIGDSVPIGVLDKLKQTLYDAADASKRSGEKNLAREVDGLRTRLTSKLDDASPKDNTGRSIYKLARDTFAGHSELMNAVENGKKALFETADNIRDLTAGMSATELQAFKTGAMQSIKEKLGTESGQTQIMKMWKEQKTSERLQQIFGHDYRAFASEVAKEARLKGLEGVGGGSLSAKRLFAAGDLDSMPVGEVGSAVANLKTGNLLGLADAGKKAWNRVQMPENTRNALGNLLLKKGSAGKQDLNSLSAMLDQINANKISRAGSIGAELGYQSGRIKK